MDSVLARNRYAADCDLGDFSEGETLVSDERKQVTVLFAEPESPWGRKER